VRVPLNLRLTRLYDIGDPFFEKDKFHSCVRDNHSFFYLLLDLNFIKKLATKMLFLPPQLGLTRLYDICNPFLKKTTLTVAAPLCEGWPIFFYLLLIFFF
jgi:hypothetical protein